MSQPADPLLAPASTPGRPASPALSWPRVWVLILVLSALSAIAMAWGKQVGLFLPVLTFAVSLIAAWYDSATGNIPNPITYTAILLGLGINCIFAMPGLQPLAHWFGTVGPVEAWEGFALCAGIGIACMLLRQMGGGDMKVLAVIGACLGFHQAIPVLMCALAVGVIYGILNLLVAGLLNRVVAAISMQLLELVYLKQAGPVERLSKWWVPFAGLLMIGLLLSRVGIAAGWKFWPFG